MYSNELNMNFDEFEITVSILDLFLGEEFEKNVVLQNNFSYESIIKSMARSSLVASAYNISLEDYIELIIKCNLTVKRCAPDNTNLSKNDISIKAGYFLKTLIIRVCNQTDDDGNTIQKSDDFMESFNNVLNNYKLINSTYEKINLCTNIIGLRNRDILHSLLETYYI